MNLAHSGALNGWEWAGADLAPGLKAEGECAGHSWAFLLTNSQSDAHILAFSLVHKFTTLIQPFSLSRLATMQSPIDPATIRSPFLALAGLGVKSGFAVPSYE